MAELGQRCADRRDTSSSSRRHPSGWRRRGRGRGALCSSGDIMPDARPPVGHRPVRLDGMSTSLVTGATAGIGHEFARQLAARGDDLVLVARDTARLEEVAADLASSYGVATEVLSRRPHRPRPARHGRGPARRPHTSGRPARQQRRVRAQGQLPRQRHRDRAGAAGLLVRAVLRLTHAALGGMVERESGGVINVSSVAAFLPRGTYSAAKAWVNSFSAWAHNEYGDRGVNVMALCPGFVKTEFHERLGVDRDSTAPKALWLEAAAWSATPSPTSTTARRCRSRASVQGDRHHHRVVPRPSCSASRVSAASLVCVGPGTEPSTVVPCPGTDITSRRPPSAPIRSVMFCSPALPSPDVVSNPRPSSEERGTAGRRRRCRG